MDNKELINKLNKIISEFVKSGAKLWFIGTNFLNSWVEILKKIRNIIATRNDFSINNSFIEIQEYNKSIGNTKYKMYFLGQNICPATTNENSAAKSTIRQYLQIGASLGFIDFKQEDVIEDGANFRLLSPIFENQNLIDRIIQTLCISIHTPIKFKRNFCFSLLLCLIVEFDESIFKKLDPEIKIQSIKDKNKFGDLCLNDEETIQRIKVVDGISKSKNGNYYKVYHDTVDIILRKEYNIFTNIVDNIYDFLINQDINRLNLITNESFKNSNDLANKEKLKNYKTVINWIDQNRGSLRKNILENRIGTTVDTKYYDITNSNTNNIHVSQMDACHIFDIQYIKKELATIYENNNNYSIQNDEKIKEQIEYLKESATNFNNGILLTKSCHKLFDEGIVWFDVDGKLNYVSEIVDEVKKFFGDDCDNIYIRQETLTYEMKNYLQKRLIYR